jgi:hypothetical protein
MTHRGRITGHEWTAVRLGHERRPKQEDLRIVPSGMDQAQFPVLFARNGERNLLGDENRTIGSFWDRGGFAPRYCELFEQMVRAGLLPGFIEIYIERNLKLKLTRI